MQRRMDWHQMWNSTTLSILLRRLHFGQFNQWMHVSVRYLSSTLRAKALYSIVFYTYSCVDGTIHPCSSSKYSYAPAAMEAISIFSIVCLLIVLLLLVTIVFGSVVYVLRCVYKLKAMVLGFRKVKYIFKIHNSFSIFQKAPNMSAILTRTIEWMRWNDKSNVHGRNWWYASVYSHGRDKGIHSSILIIILFIIFCLHIWPIFFCFLCPRFNYRVDLRIQCMNQCMQIHRNQRY